MIIPDWAKELNCSITVCDKDGVIIYQNDPAVRQYEKQGVHKFIFQSAWKEDGEVKGLCEISIITPSEMPHYVRD